MWNLIATALRLFGFFDWVQGWLDRREAKEEGRQEQQNADLKAANDSLRRQAEAEASSPTTRQELEETLRRGEL